MNILITGAAGFVGKNLTAALQSIRDGKDRTHPGLTVEKLYLYDIDSPAELLEEACQKADYHCDCFGCQRFGWYYPHCKEREKKKKEESFLAFF